MLIHRTVTGARRSALCRWLASKAGVNDKDHGLEGGTSTEETAADLDLEDSSLMNVREFLRKNEPPPKPLPPQSSREWPLQMFPDTRNVTGKENETPLAGNNEAEREWLNFGGHRQKVTGQSPVHRLSGRDEQYIASSGRDPLHRATTRSKYNPSFHGNTVSMGWQERISQPEIDAEGTHEKWFAQGEANQQQSETTDRSRLNERPGPPSPQFARKEHSADGFEDIMSAIKENQSRTQSQHTSSIAKQQSTTPRLYQGYFPAALERQSMDASVKQEGAVQPEVDEETSKADEVYRQIVAENMSEAALHSVDDVPQNYDYDPHHPRWLDPPDGESIGAPPQREFNDFKPGKVLPDFYNESSSDRFDDPGQDPAKTDRHKLYGEEYWVARPMLMEKYDYGDAAPDYQVSPDPHKDLDPEIPRYFVNEDGSMAELTVAETKEYPDFYKSKVNRYAQPETEQLYRMKNANAIYTKTVSITGPRLMISNRPWHGYSVPTKRCQKKMRSIWKDEIEDWLFEESHERDTAYNPLYAAQWIANDPEMDLKYEHDLKLQNFTTSSQVPVPTNKRIEEIEILEGLTEPGPLSEEELASLEALKNGRAYHERISNRDLSIRMEAERRYRDLFSNEANDHLPDTRIHQAEQLEALRRLHGPDPRKGRTINQLLLTPSRDDFDPWLLKELEKYKKSKGDRYEDVFSLVIHPKMLEAAFASLRQRRPGSVPGVVENGFFELASSLLSAGEVKPETAATAKESPDVQSDEPPPL